MSTKHNKIRMTHIGLMIITPIVVLLLFVLASPVTAARPDKVEIIFEPFIIRDTQDGLPCGSFDVQLDPLSQKVKLISFSSGVIIASGTLKVRLTNLSTGKSVDLNISGPIRLEPQPDGSLRQITLGPTLFAFDPGVAPGLPLLALFHGRSESEFDTEGNFHFLSVKGRVQDVCALLTGS